MCSYITVSWRRQELVCSLQDATYCSNDKDPIGRGTAIQNWAKKGKKVQKSTIKKCSKVVISVPEMVRSDREIALWLRWTDMCDRVNCLSSINCFVFFKKKLSVNSRLMCSFEEQDSAGFPFSCFHSTDCRL